MASADNQGTDDRLLIEYLLGALPEKETERFDELSITDEQFAWRLNAAENDLVDAYVRGELSGADLNRFKTTYLSSPKRRHKVEFAEGLLAFEHRTAGLAVEKKAQGSIPQSVERLPFWRAILNPRLVYQWGLAVASLALLVAGGFLLRANLGLRKQVTEAQGQAAKLTQRVAEMERQVDRERAAKQDPRQTEANVDQLKIVSLLLPPPTRGPSAIETVSLHPGNDLVVLVLTLDSDDFPGYQVKLKDSSANQVLWQSTKLAASGQGRKVVSVGLPARILNQKNYSAQLTGIKGDGSSEIIGDYPFRVLLAQHSPAQH